jgi:peptidoglycan/LPS O-acetylase OafA/YrhL
LGGRYTQTLGYSLLAAGYSALLLHLFFAQNRYSKALRLFSSGPMKAMGKYSYGIYVWHVPILTIANLFFGPIILASRNPVAPWAFVATLFGLSFVVAEASYQLFEKRFLALKERFEPRFESEETLLGVAVP